MMLNETTRDWDADEKRQTRPPCRRALYAIRAGKAEPCRRCAVSLSTVPQADWQHFHLPEVQAHFPFAFVAQTITPLQRLGALELITGEHPLTGELTVIPTPGHTPGHTSLRIESGGERALLIADALLHPAQVTEPDWISMFDVDPDQERRTRRALLDQLESEALVFSASHFPEPAFGRVVRQGGRRYWQPQDQPQSLPQSGVEAQDAGRSRGRRAAPRAPSAGRGEPRAEQPRQAR